VAYAGPLPRNATDCAKIQVSQVTYDSFSNQLGSVTSKNGGWTGTECLYPITGSPRLTRGQHRELVQAIDQFGQIQPVRVTLFALP